MKINDLSDVQQLEVFTIQKEVWKYYRDGLQEVLKRMENLKENHLAIKDLLTKSLEVIEAAKGGKAITFQDSLIITKTICYTIAIVEDGVQSWAKGEGDIIEVRLSTHHRKYLVYLLYQLADYQTKIIYNLLMS